MKWMLLVAAAALFAPQQARAETLFDPRFDLIAQFAAKKGGWFPAGQFTVTTNEKGHVGFVTQAKLPLQNPMTTCDVKFIIDNIAETHTALCNGAPRNDLLPSMDADRIRSATAVHLMGWVQGWIQSRLELLGQNVHDK